MRALACLYLVAISAACTYTSITNTPPAVGPGGAVVAVGAPPIESTPAPGDNLRICPSGESCSWDCDGGGCAFECSSGASCNIQCDGGNCKIDVATGASTNAQCDGGHCETACASGASCDFQCDGGGCSVACSANSSCNFDCDKGDCTTREADAS
jgi:hypothetical protein